MGKFCANQSRAPTMKLGEEGRAGLSLVRLFVGRWDGKCGPKNIMFRFLKAARTGTKSFPAQKFSKGRHHEDDVFIFSYFNQDVFGCLARKWRKEMAATWYVSSK